LYQQAAADAVIGMLWRLMEAGLEELKLLQTAILLLTINSVVQHESLAKVCLHLNVILCAEKLMFLLNFHTFIYQFYFSGGVCW
jgi:hypothetical protein